MKDLVPHTCSEVMVLPRKPESALTNAPEASKQQGWHACVTTVSSAPSVGGWAEEELGRSKELTNPLRLLGPPDCCHVTPHSLTHHFPRPEGTRSCTIYITANAYHTIPLTAPLRLTRAWPLCCSPPPSPPQFVTQSFAWVTQQAGTWFQQKTIPA